VADNERLAEERQARRPLPPQRFDSACVRESRVRLSLPALPRRVLPCADGARSSARSVRADRHRVWICHSEVEVASYSRSYERGSLHPHSPAAPIAAARAALGGDSGALGSRQPSSLGNVAGASKDSRLVGRLARFSSLLPMSIRAHSAAPAVCGQLSASAPRLCAAGFDCLRLGRDQLCSSRCLSAGRGWTWPQCGVGKQVPQPLDRQHDLRQPSTRVSRSAPPMLIPLPGRRGCHTP
jgi:hypothetical protein